MQENEQQEKNNIFIETFGFTLIYDSRKTFTSTLRVAHVLDNISEVVLSTGERRTRSISTKYTFTSSSIMKMKSEAYQTRLRYLFKIHLLSPTCYTRCVKKEQTNVIKVNRQGQCR